MRHLWSLIICGVFLGTCVLTSGADEELNYRAPTLLADTRPEMLTPGFWNSRHPSADTVILDAQGIADFNAAVRAKIPSVRDIADPAETYSGEELLTTLRNVLQEFKDKPYFSSSGEAISEMALQDLSVQLNLTSVPSVIEPSFAFALRYTSQRFLPTDEPFYERPGDTDFDYLQNSALEFGTPVIVLHKSFDGHWAYVLGPSSEGWVKSEDLVECALKDIQEFATVNRWAVVTEARADVFGDPQLTQFDQSLPMGWRLPQDKKQESPGVMAVKVPSARSDGRFAFKTVYLERRDVSDGFLPYTPRTIFKQAFKLLNRPYGWGGMYREQDCSLFLKQIFATVGLDLPRDSKDQAKAGQSMILFDNVVPAQARNQKNGFFAKPNDGIRILTLKGHIMLYLGNVDGRNYAIHSVWAYREPTGDEDRVRVVNRVAVSSLDLGEGSKKGSLYERLTGVRTFTNGH